MSKVFLILALILAGSSFAQPVKISFYSEKHTVSSSGTDQYEADKPATSFTPVTNAAPVYISLDFPDPSEITAKDKLYLVVLKKTAAGESYSYSQDMRIPKKKGNLKVKAVFMPGDYIARLSDKDNESTVFGTASFTVTAPSAMPDYKNNSTFVACESVNDDWNAVGETKSIKAGSCIGFLYKASKSQSPIMHFNMIWSIRLMKADGSEDFVNDLEQMVEVNAKGWRYLAADKMCEFSKPGKYRVYLFDKETSDAHHGVSEDYYGKMEFMVQ